MRNIVFTLLILFTSCIPAPELWQRKYIIENSSNVPVRVIFFVEGDSSAGFLSKRLEVLERLEGGWVDLGVDPSSRPENELEGLPLSSYRADSVVIVFNNQAKLSYSTLGISIFSEPLDRNLFRNSNYEAIGDEEFLYKIIPADFDRADDCGGDCN